MVIPMDLLFPIPDEGLKAGGAPLGGAWMALSELLTMGRQGGHGINRNARKAY